MNNSILDKMYKCDRVLITAQLKPTNNGFLQPTGFPDIGACIYRDGSGKRRCLVESEQSMANRLEAVCMEFPGIWVSDLAHLPLIKVCAKIRKDEDDILLATNLTEPHRIASSYILDGKYNGTRTLKDFLKDRFGLIDNKKNDGKKDIGALWPLDKRENLEATIFDLDPGALIHGFQFVQWKFVGLRQPRLLHARLEAQLAGEPELHYGMVKFDNIEPESTSESRANKGQSIAVKSRIIPETGKITATFELDVLGLKCLRLPENQKKSLLALALWKIGAFLNNNPAFDPRSRQPGPALRLRADCYLECGKVNWTGTSGSTRENEDEEPSAGSGISPANLLETAKATINQWPKLDLDKNKYGELFKKGGESEKNGPVLTVIYSKKNSSPESNQPGDDSNDES